MQALALVRPSEHQALLLSLRETGLSEEPLHPKELEMASLYWSMFAGNLVGEHYTCEGGCDAPMPNSGLLTNDPAQTDHAARVHLEMGVASTCRECTRRHLLISEALSHHSELLRCAEAKDPKGAQEAARHRCTLIAQLKG